MDNFGVHYKSFITLLFYQITVKVCVFMVDVLKTREAIRPVFVMMVIKVWIAAIQLVSSNQITLNSAYWEILHAFLSSAIFFFQNQLFRKILSGIPSECQRVWIQIRPNILSGLVWIQTVCKGYQQTTPVDKELIIK